MGIERVTERLDDIGEDAPEPFANAVGNRAAQASKRAEQAQSAEKLS
jgi:hypothetical protein